MFRLDEPLFRLLFHRANAQCAVDVQLHDDVGVIDRHYRHSIVIEQSHGGYFPCDVKVVVGVEVAPNRPRVEAE
ncbi:hypothetical protein [Nocardia spumae]|uniref:hypothetical protein n=1 Tax=Nocardia spumae TaxID=2887190 RepID=UPI001D155D86|nr:hypothetical protein [Nocardia spumae]